VIWVVQRPIATWMITIALLVFGFVSYQRLPLNLMPDLSYPTITIRTEANGYAPEEVETQVSRLIEESVATTPGLTKLESRSRANSSDIILAFKWGTEMNKAIQDVREQLQMISFPNDVQRPLILRYDPTLDPIIRIALSKETGRNPQATLSELRTVAEQVIKRDLEGMDGVAAVRIRGGFEKEVHVLLREDWLQARGITSESVIQTIGAENVNIPGGSILEGRQEYLVRTLNAFNSIDELKSITIRRSDGVEVKLNEVAEIQDSFKERQVLSRINGQESVELEVYKTADANIVQIAQQIKNRIGSSEEAQDQIYEKKTKDYASKSGRRYGRDKGSGKEDRTIRENLPKDISLILLEDQSRFIESAINNLRSTALMGAFLAVIVLFLFLKNFRATAIIGAAIPLSILVTFAPMYLYDVSLNLMSLGGLALGIGMLVDNAVVVLENIQVHLDKGLSRKQAASIGVKEVTTAVISSTLTTISVFLPITFVEGAAGQIFGDLSLAVVFSLLASLAVALFFVPMLAASEVKIEEKQKPPPFRERFTAISEFKEDWKRIPKWKRVPWLIWGIPRFLLFLIINLLSVAFVYPIIFGLWICIRLVSIILPPLKGSLLFIAALFQRFYSVIDEWYGSWLNPILHRSGTILGLVVLAIILSLGVSQNLGQTLLPELHQGRFAVQIDLPIGTPLQQTSNISGPLEKRLRTIENVDYVYSIVGADSRINSQSGTGEHSIRLMIGLTDPSPEKEELLMQQVRQEVLSIRESSNWSVNLKRPALFSFETPLEIVLYAKELDILRKASGQVEERLNTLSGLTDIQSSLSEGYPEIQIRYDREKLQRYNLTTSTAAQRVKEKIQGERATTLSYGENRIDLIVRLAEDDRRDISKLQRINVNPAINPPVPLSMVASFEETEGPSEIRRIDQQRAVVISANLEGFDLSRATENISSSLQQYDSKEVFWEIAGQSDEMKRSMTSLQFALSLAIFLVYVIMASAFESILHPFVILFSVPLALIGVIFCLWAFAIPVSVIVLIGSIVLAGVVVNNAIVLVDTINRKRSENLSRKEAIYEASRLRLRPILITTLTTALGLLPLALGLGEGSEIQQPLAITIIAGLLSSTLLTLVIIPIIYLQLTSRLERKS
jgi:hydrophobic/amphiphilic exporter-1 (mainly G- bacteria), HAE1 family